MEEVLLEEYFEDIESALLEAENIEESQSEIPAHEGTSESTELAITLTAPDAGSSSSCSVREYNML